MTCVFLGGMGGTELPVNICTMFYSMVTLWSGLFGSVSTMVAIKVGAGMFDVVRVGCENSDVLFSMDMEGNIVVTKISGNYPCPVGQSL